MPKVKVARTHYGDSGLVARGSTIEVDANRQQKLGTILVGGKRAEPEFKGLANSDVLTPRPRRPITQPGKSSKAKAKAKPAAKQ